MTVRALSFLVSNMRSRPLAPTVPRMAWLEPYSSSPTKRTLCTSLGLRIGLSDEDEVILLVGTTNNKSRIR